MKKVLVIGESCCDVFKYGNVTRLEPSAPVPVFNSIYENENPGMAHNVLNNLLTLGVSSDIHTNENWKNITKTRFVEKKTNHMFLRVDENDKGYGRSSVKEIDYSLYDAVIISDYDKGFLTVEDMKHVKSRHETVFLDTKKPIGEWALDCATYIKINNYELAKSEEVTEELREKLIVTLGPDGASHKGVTYTVPSVEIKDLSGAGDTFISGLVKRYIENKDICSSIDFANECATKVVQKRGVSVVA